MDLAELAMMLESVNAKEVSIEEFEQAASLLSQMKGLSNDQKLQFYGLYKQATVGDVNTTQPWSINMVAKAKW
jgi:acyl-CoA-binding protein